MYIFNIYIYVQKVLRHPHIQMCMFDQNRRMDGLGLGLDVCWIEIEIKIRFD